MGERNSSILLIHDDPELLDSLTDLLEGAGFDVAIAGTAFAATNLLEDRAGVEEFDAVVAGWGTGGRSGLRVYCWVLEHMHAMRDRFVFLAEEEPLGFKTLVKERCPLVRPSAGKEILKTVVTMVGQVLPPDTTTPHKRLASPRVEPPQASRTEPPRRKPSDARVEPVRESVRVRRSDPRRDPDPPKPALPDSRLPAPRLPAPPGPGEAGALAAKRLAASEDVSAASDDEIGLDSCDIFSVVAANPIRPKLLLVEDDPLLLKFMTKRFSSAGFSVTSTDGGNEAIRLLGAGEYDVILADWYMLEGSGADIYEWLLKERPSLLTRCFFMSGSVGAEAHADIAPKGCKVFAKGQDADRLIQELMAAAREGQEENRSRRPTRQS